MPVETKARTLRQQQSAFAQAFGQLIGFVCSKGWELTFGDGCITPLGPDGKGRKARLVSNGQLVKVEDVVHMRGGQHYRGLAQDVNLFIDGQWISDGGHPAWRTIGEFWVSLDPDARWGGYFDDVDANHLSFAFGGKQ
jgi:hypothetical protein